MKLGQPRLRMRLASVSIATKVVINHVGGFLEFQCSGRRWLPRVSRIAEVASCTISTVM